METLSKTSEKIKSLEQGKKALEEKLIKIKKEEMNCLEYEGVEDNYFIKIQSKSLFGQKGCKTARKLDEVLCFLSEEKNIMTTFEERVPKLNLDLGFLSDKPKMPTERIELSNPERFIPIRTQRTTKLNKSGNLQTMDT